MNEKSVRQKKKNNNVRHFNKKSQLFDAVISTIT